MSMDSSSWRAAPASDVVARPRWRDRYPAIASPLASPVPAALLVFGASLLVIGLCSYRDPNVYDEGVAVYGAERILRGEVPYRDFWTLYAPAHLYLLAALFELFGTHLVVERHAWVLLQAVLGLLLFLTARRLAGAVWAAVCWVIAVIWLTRVPLFGAPIRPAMVLSFGALLAALVALDALAGHSADQRGRRATRLIVLAGVLTGLCTLFRQDIGFYTFLGIVATFALAVRFARPRPAAASAAPTRAATPSQAAASSREGQWHPAIIFVASTACVLVPAVLMLLAVVPAAVLFEQLVTFPVFVYPRVRALPLPEWPASPLGLLRGEIAAFDYFKAHARGWQWFPAILLLAGTTIGSLIAIVRGAAAARERDRHAASRTPALALFLVSFTGLLTLNYARVQSDIFHLLLPLLFALITGVALIARTARWRVCWPHALLLCGALAGVAGVIALTWQTERKIRQRQSPLDSPRTTGMTTPRRSSGYTQLVAYIQQTVPADAPFFVGSQQHDAIAINDVLLYFLTARRSATRYHELHPGVATTIPVQAEIVRELEAARVDCIVLRDEERPRVSEVEARSGLTGATVLDRYIAGHFVRGPRFDEYQVWRRAPAR